MQDYRRALVRSIVSFSVLAMDKQRQHAPRLRFLNPLLLAQTTKIDTVYDAVVVAHTYTLRHINGLLILTYAFMTIGNLLTSPKIIFLRNLT